MLVTWLTKRFAWNFLAPGKRQQRKSWQSGRDCAGQVSILCKGPTILVLQCYSMDTRNRFRYRSLERPHRFHSRNCYCPWGSYCKPAEKQTGAVSKSNQSLWTIPFWTHTDRIVDVHILTVARYPSSTFCGQCRGQRNRVDCWLQDHIWRVHVRPRVDYRHLHNGGWK